MKKLIRYAIGFAIAVAAAFILGWGVYGLGKLYLALIGKYTPQTTVSEEKQVLHLPKFEVYFLQMGIFKDKANAEKLISGLNQQGTKAIILQDGSYYRIGAGYFGSWTAAGQASERLKELNAVEKSILVNALSYKVSPTGGEPIGKVLVNYGEILAGAAETFSAADVQYLSGQELTRLVNSVEKLQSENKGLQQKLYKTSLKFINKQALESLRQQGDRVETSLKTLALQANKDNYVSAQRELLLLLSVYRECLNSLQK